MDKLKPAATTYLNMLSDIMTTHWYDTVPRSIPASDNREAKYLNTAVLSVGAVSQNNFENILPQILAQYRSTPAFGINAKISPDVETGLCLECCRTFFPDYIFEMMTNNSTGMRTFFNNMLSGAFSQSLALLKDYTKADITLILKNDSKFRKFTHDGIATTLVAFRNSIYNKAIQSDISRTETPAMLKDEIIRLKKNLHVTETTLKTKVAEYDSMVVRMRAADTELSAARHDNDINDALAHISSRLSAIESHMDDRHADMSKQMANVVSALQAAAQNMRQPPPPPTTERLDELCASMSGQTAAQLNAIVATMANTTATQLNTVCTNLTEHTTAQLSDVCSQLAEHIRDSSRIDQLFDVTQDLARRVSDQHNVLQHMLQTFLDETTNTSSKNIILEAQLDTMNSAVSVVSDAAMAADMLNDTYSSRGPAAKPASAAIYDGDSDAESVTEPVSRGRFDASSAAGMTDRRDVLENASSLLATDDRAGSGGVSASATKRRPRKAKA